VWGEPAPEIRQDLQKRRDEWLARRQALLETSHSLAFTRDRRRVEVFANIGRVMDARAAADNGAEGVGLLRTEFLFLTRQDPPTEKEQLEALLQIGEVLGDLPVTVRTLDIGGDKEVPYLNLPKEANPFLGLRAIRISLNSPEFFLAQLRAILQAGARHPVRIMFPMIATIEEVWKAKALLEKARLSLKEENLPHAWPIETGIMVEVPSAAVLSPVLAREVDFFSIGTNDLTQYTMAAERGSPELANLADAMHPAVLQLIGYVAAAAHAEGKWVGVCGELAGDPQASAVLIGLGVDELSLNPGGIPAIKDIVRKIDSREAADLAVEVLKCQHAQQVREKAAAYLKNLSK
jgi:multiphosphoryl transfer protein